MANAIQAESQGEARTARVASNQAKPTTSSEAPLWQTLMARWAAGEVRLLRASVPD